MAKANKVDLTLLKKFVGELEASLATADGIKAAEGDVAEYIVELSKAAGLCAGIMQESGMLIADVQSQVMAVQSPSPSAGKPDILEKLLGSLKGPGNSGTSN